MCRDMKLGRLLAAVLAILSVPMVATAHHDEVVDRTGREKLEIVSLSSSTDRQVASTDANCANPTIETAQTEDRPSVSSGGRFVAFSSAAADLHPDDTNGNLATDVFVRDRQKRTTDLVSVMDGSSTPPELGEVGEVLNNVSCINAAFNPAISKNGRFVAFADALPLVESSSGSSDSGRAPAFQVYIRDRKRRVTELVSVTHQGDPMPGNSGVSTVEISDDGRYVVFSNLLDRVDTTSLDGSCLTANSRCAQIYLRDRAKGETVLVSGTSTGEPGNGHSPVASISSAGQHVAFNSTAGDLVSLDNNSCPKDGLEQLPSCTDVFLFDLQTQKTQLISYDREGQSGNGQSFISPGMVTSAGRAVSSDGRDVIFYSEANNIVPVRNAAADTEDRGTYIRDTKTERVERVSVDSAGRAVADGPGSAFLSADGGHVLWTGSSGMDCSTSPGCNQKPGHEAGVFLFDRSLGQLTQIVLLGDADHATFGTGTSDIDDSLRFGVWEATDGTYGPTDTNEGFDVYLADLGRITRGLGEVMSAGRSASGSAIGLPRESQAPLPAARLSGATLAYRPDLDDLYLRIDVERLDGAIAISPILYGARFTTSVGDFELRATQDLASPGGGDFGLFRCAGESCVETAELSGGYGTVGESIVASVSLDELGLAGDGAVTDIEIFSSLGTYSYGPAVVLDEFALDGIKW